MKKFFGFLSIFLTILTVGLVFKTEQAHAHLGWSTGRPSDVPYAGKSTIALHAYEYDTGKPVAGAVFHVTQQLRNGGKQIVTIVTTDSSGWAVTRPITAGEYVVEKVEDTPKGTGVHGKQWDTRSAYVSKKAPEVIHYGMRLNSQSPLPPKPDPIVYSDLKIVKKDAETGVLLAGAVFSIEDSAGNITKTNPTDGSGQVTVKKLKIGNYIVREITAPAGYKKDPSSKTVVLDKWNKSKTVTFLNEKGKGRIEINKKNESNQPLAGAVFDIIQNGKTIATITSGTNGKAVTNELPYGEYEVKETKAPNGYQLDPEVKKVTLSESTPNDKHVISWTNIAVKSSIVIIKRNETGTTLSGAEFEVTNSNGDVVGKETTEGNGIAIFTGLVNGTYKVRETKAPAGYILSNEIKEVVLSGNQKTLTWTNVKIPEVIKGSLVIRKVNEQGVPLSGARFAILKERAGGTPTPYGHVVSDKNGLARLDGIPQGNYLVAEAKAPEGYEQDTTERKFSIVKNGDTINFNWVNTKIPDKGAIVIEKVNESSQALAGAVFDIIDSNGKVVKSVTTGADGKGTASGLVYGNYKVKETKAPEGYVLDSTPKDVVVDRSQVVLSWVNVKIPTGTLKIGLYVRTIDGDPTKIGLEGGEFKITIVDTSGGTQVFEKKVTNSKGLILENLPEGKVTVEQTKAPNGYKLGNGNGNPTLQKGEIEAGKEYEMKFYNSLDSGGSR